MRSSPRLRLRHFKADSGATSHSAWVERPWPSIGTLYRTTPHEPFAASAVSLLLGDLIVHRADFTAQRWVRDAQLIAATRGEPIRASITGSW